MATFFAITSDLHRVSISRKYHANPGYVFELVFWYTDHRTTHYFQDKDVNLVADIINEIVADGFEKQPDPMINNIDLGVKVYEKRVKAKDNQAAHRTDS